MSEAVRPRVLEAGLHVFVTALNGHTVSVVEPFYAAELEAFIKIHIKLWHLEQTLALVRVGPTVTLKRIDDGPGNKAQADAASYTVPGEPTGVVTLSDDELEEALARKNLAAQLNPPRKRYGE
jgi:hypothetical protein